MRTVIQSFALGIIISTTILAVVYFIHTNNDETVEVAELNEADARDLLEEEGYTVVLSSDYNQTLDENDSLKQEIIVMEQQIDNLKDELAQTNLPIEESNGESSFEETEEEESMDSETDEENEGEDEIEEDDRIDFTLTISRGMTSIDISQILYENNIVDNAEQFNQFLEQNGYSRRIQLGENKLHSNMNYTEIANVITD